MSWAIEWKALSHRIHGLLEAGQFFSQVASVTGNDSYKGDGIILLEQAGRIFNEIESFARRFSNKIPDRANKTLDQFVTQRGSRFTNSRNTNDLDIARGLTCLMLLTAFESELSFLLSDMQVHIQRRSERAFVHLQRSIMADPEIRKKWRNAFEKGEVECEKLGAVHLLLHGIWAFKADAAGGRTDLVLGEPLEDTDLVERVAEGLVLTEWKLAQELKDVARQFEEARNQAARYTRETLAGIELLDYRFLVVVTEKGIDELEDLQSNGVVYRRINIAVDPVTPSRA